MAVSSRRQRSLGFSLIEVLIVVSILAVLLAVGAQFIKDGRRLALKAARHSDVQQSAQIALPLAQRLIQAAEGSSMRISQKSGQPPYSWIRFNLLGPSGTKAFELYQQGSELYLKEDGNPRRLAANLQGACFTYPDYPADLGLLRISFSFSKGSPDELLTVGETVRLQNPPSRSLDRGL